MSGPGLTRPIVPFGALSIKPQRPKLEDTEPPTDYMCQIRSMLYHCASVARGLHLSSACVFWSAWVVRSAPRRPQRTNEITRKLSGLGGILGIRIPGGLAASPRTPLQAQRPPGQSVAEGNKLDGTPIGKRTLTRPSRCHFCAESLWSMDGIAPNLTRPWEG